MKLCHNVEHIILIGYSIGFMGAVIEGQGHPGPFLIIFDDFS